MKRALALVTLLALTLPTLAFAQEAPATEEETKFDPSHEWELQTWGPELKIGRSTRPSRTSCSERCARFSSASCSCA